MTSNWIPRHPEHTTWPLSIFNNTYKTVHRVTWSDCVISLKRLCAAILHNKYFLKINISSLYEARGSLTHRQYIIVHARRGWSTSFIILDVASCQTRWQPKRYAMCWSYPIKLYSCWNKQASQVCIMQQRHNIFSWVMREQEVTIVYERGNELGDESKCCCCCWRK